MNRPQVLLLDDELTDGLTVSAYLTRKGYEVTLVRTGRAALVRARAGQGKPWAAMVIDAMLNDQDDLKADPEYYGQIGGLKVLRAMAARDLIGEGCAVFVFTRFPSEIQDGLLRDFSDIKDIIQSSNGGLVRKVGHGTRRLAVELARRIQPVVGRDAPGEATPPLLEDLSGLAPVLEEVRETAGNDVPLLLYGEPGVGKESLARYAYRWSGRAGPFKALAVGALDGEAATYALCGRARGFPQPHSPEEAGAFEAASYGVLYISDLDKYTANSKQQLNVLFTALGADGDRYVSRMGGKEVIAVHCGMIASVNDIDALHPALVDRFHPVRVPPLRERPEDIEPLARFLWPRVRRASGLMGGDLDLPADPTVFEKLRALPLPGNVRDLERWARTGRLPAARGGDPVGAPPPDAGPALHITIRSGADGRARYADLLGNDGSVKRDYWLWLQRQGLDIKGMSRVSGMSRGQVVTQLERFQIVAPGLGEADDGGEFAEDLGGREED